jgi:PadR family transcriptional regulator PadR
MNADLPVIGEFEQMVLLAVLQTQDDAYGVTVHEELQKHTDRPVARGAVYMTLDRLEKKGLLTSTLSAPTAERGGRAKRCYAVTRTAIAALRTSRRTLLSLWDGLEPMLGK